MRAAPPGETGTTDCGRLGNRTGVARAPSISVVSVPCEFLRSDSSLPTGYGRSDNVSKGGSAIDPVPSECRWVRSPVPYAATDGSAEFVSGRHKGSGMLQTPSTERRAVGGDRPLSGGCVEMHPIAQRRIATLHP